MKDGAAEGVGGKMFLAPKKEKQEETDSSPCGCCHIGGDTCRTAILLSVKVKLTWVEPSKESQ